MKKLLSLFLFMAAFVATPLLLSSPAYAVDENNGNKCAGVDVAILKCDASGGENVEDSGVWALLIIALNILAGLVGIVAVGGIVYGAIMYASAQDNASQVQEAIGIIRNVVIGLVLFLSMYALLQFLIPGGVFGSGSGNQNQNQNQNQNNGQGGQPTQT